MAKIIIVQVLITHKKTQKNYSQHRSMATSKILVLNTSHESQRKIPWGFIP